MKTIRAATCLLAIFVVIQLVGCSNSHQGQVTIFHTNDMHSQYVPLQATWIQTEPKPLIGGMVALDYVVRQYRSLYPNSLLLDSGDFTTGTPLSTMRFKGTLNGGMVEMMNLMGYDGVTIGNHEFDEGQENLANIVELAEFDIISANLFKHDDLIAPMPYQIYRVNKLRIGVIGILLKNLANVTAKKHLNDVVVQDPATIAQQYINEIDQKTDLIILLTHQGTDDDVSLADHVSNADIIVGGHSHSRLEQALERDDILIVQAGAKTRYLGRLTVDVVADTVANYEYELIPTWVDSVKSPHPRIATLTDSFQTRINAEYNNVIGTLHIDWRQNQYGESNLGNFICDAMRQTTGTDIALMNGGGIRKNLPAGPVTKLDIVEILPFSNYVVTFECSGADLLRLVDENITAAVNQSYNITQVSGLSYTYRVRDRKGTRVQAQVNNKPISADAMYSCTTVDYLFDILKDKGTVSPEQVQQTPYIISDLLVEYINEHPQINTTTDDRIRKIR